MEGAETYSKIEQEATNALLSLPQPVVASIHGFCMGGGLNLALAADMRFCAEDARFAVPPGKLGIGYPLELMDLLASTVGRSYAKELVFTAKVIDAAEALRIGLVNAVLPKAELDQHVLDVAAGICDLAPLTLRAAKLAAEQAPGAAEACAACFESADYKEGVTAFMERRPAAFAGK